MSPATELNVRAVLLALCTSGATALTVQRIADITSINPKVVQNLLGRMRGTLVEVDREDRQLYYWKSLPISTESIDKRLETVIATRGPSRVVDIARSLFLSMRTARTLCNNLHIEGRIHVCDRHWRSGQEILRYDLGDKEDAPEVTKPDLLDQVNLERLRQYHGHPFQHLMVCHG